MLSVEITKSIHKSLISEAVHMDHEAYLPEDQITWERAATIYGRNGDSLILLKDDQLLIGYLSVFLVNRIVVDKAVKSRSPIYKQPLDDLLQLEKHTGDVYIHNIIIKPQFQQKGYRKLLFIGLHNWVLRHTIGTDFWADVVTEKGAQAVKAIGLMPLPECDDIWQADTSIVINKLQLLL